MDGKFLFKIEKRGRGPEEYTYIVDFDVSSDNKILIILSRNKLFDIRNFRNRFYFSEIYNTKRSGSI